MVTGMSSDLADTVAVVTGAGRGIGRAIAMALGQAGADVVLAARSVDALEDVATELRSIGRRPLVVPTDLQESDSITALAEQTLEEFGVVDILVNNGGVGGPSAPVWDIDLAQWSETIAVNLTGTFLCCRAFLPSMIERGRGSIINIGSVTGKKPLLNRSAYAASKLALVGFTRTLATEAGPHGVRANLISPGGVRGERIEWVLARRAQSRGISVKEARAEIERESPLGRLVDPEEVANATVFLASDDASAITGEDLNVTSGTVMF